jgi:glycosyltransferase involved in cell wall biosynthesis
VFQLPKSHLGARSQIKKIVRELKPDIVHLHSSFAGVYGRSVNLKFKEGCSKCPGGVQKYKPKLVYTPHCYAFQRLDTSSFSRKVFYLIEKFLAPKTDIFACCSENEIKLTKGLRKRAKTIYVPNVSNLEHQDLSLLNNDEENYKSESKTTAKSDVLKKKLIVTLGRKTNQKNPELFNQIAEFFLSKNAQTDNSELDTNDVEFLWIGSDQTGWVDSHQIKDYLTHATLYLHTALWEGFPVSILDAIAMKLPVIALKGDFLYGCPEKWQFTNAQEAKDLIENLLQDKQLLEQNILDWKAATKENTDQVQYAHLNELYAH